MAKTKTLIWPAALLTTAFFAALAALLMMACDNPNKPGESGLAITDVDFIADNDGQTPFTSGKLVITFNEDIHGLKQDDIKLNAAFVILKHGFTRTGPAVYELGITPGGSGTVMVGLDPYNPSGWKWKAKTVSVYTVFHFTGTSALTITRYNGQGEEAVIPVQIAGIPVTAVGDGAFNNKSLTELVIPDAIQTIGRLAFANNQLSNIIIPVTVKYIGVQAFSLNKLTEVDINNGVLYIGDEAFRNNLLESITIPDSVTSIGNNNSRQCHFHREACVREQQVIRH